MNILSRENLSREASLSVKLPMRFSPPIGGEVALSKSVRLLPLVQTGLWKVKNAHWMYRDYPIDEAIAEIKALDNVVSIQGILAIENTKEFDQLLSPLLQTIRELELTGARIDDHSLKLIESMPHLVSLDLSDTRLSNDCIPFISSARSLRSLSLGGCERFTDAGLAILINQLPNLRAIYLHKTAAGSNTVAAILNHAHLRTADLGWCDLASADFQRLVERSNLRELYVPFVKLGQLELDKLEFTSSLKFLHVTESGLPSRIIQQLQNQGVTVSEAMVVPEFTSLIEDREYALSGIVTEPSSTELPFGPMPAVVTSDVVTPDVPLPDDSTKK